VARNGRFIFIVDEAHGIIIIYLQRGNQGAGASFWLLEL